jgi:hypothetical protein
MRPKIVFEGQRINGKIHFNAKDVEDATLRKTKIKQNLKYIM